jgi:hypothetical protein
MLILFKRLLTNDVNAKGENGKISFAFSMWKQQWWSHFDIMHAQSLVYFFFCFIGHNYINLCDFL